MNTQENNKLIAEFMGIESYPNRGYTMFIFEEDNHRTDIDLHYHTSWNWLMPVIEKINTMDDYRFSVQIHHCLTDICDTNGGVKYIVDEQGHETIEATYKAVVEFIKQYNNNSFKTSSELAQNC